MQFSSPSVIEEGTDASVTASDFGFSDIELGVSVVRIYSNLYIELSRTKSFSLYLDINQLLWLQD